MLSLDKQRPESSSSEEAQAVTPWFGCDRIDEWLIARVERLTASAGADYYLSSSKKNRAYSKTKIAPLWGVWIQRKLFSEREDVSGLLMASKICGERSGLAEEGIDYARRSLGNELSEGMQALESADITDPRVLHRLALENAEERKLDSALAYAKHALKLGAESDLEVWLLLARVLSAQKRFSDAETIVDAALNETGKWEQGKLLRLKEKFRVAKGEVKDAIVTYTQLLALLQVQSKSLSSAKKMPKGYYVEGCLIISGRCVLETILLMEAMKSGMILMVDWKRLIR
ncbi:BnaA06g19640D [Brassica napus]|uniref:BnaA06g19640D protein n=1 Tax=Brassica napus TaxID=3708 RepID=A0A078H0K3_BRANA|nr:BnaA06g19640D [Brassica napus]